MFAINSFLALLRQALIIRSVDSLAITTGCECVKRCNNRVVVVVVEALDSIEEELKTFQLFTEIRNSIVRGIKLIP